MSDSRTEVLNLRYRSLLQSVRNNVGMHGQMAVLASGIIVPQLLLIGLVGLCRISAWNFPVLTQCQTTTTLSYVFRLWDSQRWAILLLVLLLEVFRDPQEIPKAGSSWPVIVASTLGVLGSWGTVASARAVGAENPLDLLWNALRMFWLRDSPYAYFDGCLGSAATVECLHYFHTFPLVLGFLGSLPLEAALATWAAINTIFVVLCAWSISLGFRLQPLGAFTFSLIFASAPATHNVIGNGQYTLMALLLLVGLPVALRNPIAGGAVFGLGMFKVSLFFPLFMLLAVARFRAAASASAVVALAGMFSVLWLRAPAAEVLFGPFIASRNFGGLGYAEFGMGDIPRLLASREVGLGSIGSLLLAAIGSWIAIWAFRRTHDYLAALAIACLITLIVFPHLPYDYVMVCPSFALALSRYRARRTARIALASVSGVLLASPRVALRLLESLTGIETSGLRALFIWPIPTQGALILFFMNVTAAALCLAVAEGPPKERASGNFSLSPGPRRAQQRNLNADSRTSMGN